LIVRVMIDKFLKRIIARFWRVILHVRIREREERRDEQGMRNTFRSPNENVECFDRTLRIALGETQASEQKSSLAALARPLGSERAQHAISPRQLTAIDQ